MTTVSVVALAAVLFLCVGAILWRRRGGIVAKRGMSVGADLATMADKRRVVVRAVTNLGSDRVRLLLVPDAESEDGQASATSAELDLVVALNDNEFGFELLQDWKRAASPLAIVMPEGTQIVRLRSIDTLQPLTLRRAEQD